MVNKNHLFLLLFLSLPAYAGKPPAKSWTFNFHLENDLFTNTDRFYTNGIKLSWISPEMRYFEELPWLQKNTRMRNLISRLIDTLPFSKDERMQRNIALSVGQKMFTPSDIKRQDLIVDDRPYGGWLYASVAFHNKSKHKLHTLEIQAGVIGAWSLARETQDFVHEVRGLDKANGWDNQLNNEVGVAFIYDRKHRFLESKKLVERWGYDFIAHYGGALGNVFTHLNAGFELRLGWNIPADFGTALIRPAGDTNAPADSKDPRYQEGWDGFGFHIFGGAVGRLVIRDIFLDGNTFSDSHSIDKEMLVGDFVVGVSLVYRRFKLSYAQVVRTKEFELQQSGHNFGSITLSYTY